MRNATVSDFRGSTNLVSAYGEPRQALKLVSGVVLSGPATEYGELLSQIAPHLQNGQTICLVNAPLGASLQVINLLRKVNCEAQVNILELGTLFDCVTVEGNILLIIGQRDNVSFCGNTRNETRRGISQAGAITKGLVPASNVIERGLSEVEKILRPAILLFGITGGREGELDNITGLLNPAVTSVLSGLDQEVQMIAKTFKCVVPSFSKSLRDFVMHGQTVDSPVPSSIEEALVHIGNSLLEQTYSSRICRDTAMSMLKRDITETFVLLADMARLSRIAVPVINSVIELGSKVTQCDLSREGRTLEHLGLVGFDVSEVVELVNS